ncbi:phosphoribosylaminoimidazolesuccinocarboxamide synthase [Modestobacter lacusdianchii]
MSLPFELVARGKVREVYAVDDERLLLVASDRVSAYDHVLPTPIPDKGRVLTQLSVWWFEQLAPVLAEHGAEHHLLASGDALLDEGVPAELAGRSMLVRRLEMLPVECVARGYLSGSGTVEYQRSGAIVDIPLPAGLVEGSRLPEPVFTPSTKAEVGEHDEAIGFAQVVEAVGADRAEALRSLTLALYARGAEIAERAGIVLADTKFEFGTAGGPESGTAGGPEFGTAGETLVLGDEVLTPDSSRFWPAITWSPGAPQPSFDKQYVRDWLTTSGWDRASEPPELPDDVVAATRERYVKAYQQLTGLPWS